MIKAKANEFFERQTRFSKRLPRKLRIAMGHLDSVCRPSAWWELDDAPVGGRRLGKHGRSAGGKIPILAACISLCIEYAPVPLSWAENFEWRLKISVQNKLCWPI